MADALDLRTRKITREQIAAIVGNNPRAIKLFEALAFDVTGPLPDAALSAAAAAATAQEMARQALAMAGLALSVSESTTGDDGPPGPPGEQGIDGAPGPQGPIGWAVDGEPGEDAIPVPGPPGPVGPVGPAGPAGASGISTTQYVQGNDGEDGADGIPGAPGLPGAVGATGAAGATGPAGLAVFLTAEDGDQGDVGPPGPRGLTGATGATGPAGAPGASIFWLGDNGDDGDAGPVGPAGPAGATGPQGPAGSGGSSITQLLLGDTDWDDAGQWAMPPSGSMQRAQMAASAKGWQFLGTATGGAVTVGPVIWTGTYKQLMIRYWIAGYSGGTPVGRLLLGAASISTTARTNAWSLSEGVTAPSTAAGATAVPGVPLAVTLSNIGRGGTAYVDGASGSVKSIEVIGRNGTPAVATAPTLFRAASFFSDLGTNLPIQQAQLTSYDTLVAVAVSANTFTAGTYLTVWGRNDD